MQQRFFMFHTLKEAAKAYHSLPVSNEVSVEPPVSDGHGRWQVRMIFWTRRAWEASTCL